MAVRLGVPLWLEQLAHKRRPAFPHHRGHLDVDVAVVGGGLTGCLTALAFATADVRVALFEASEIGRGSTLAGSAVLGIERGPGFRSLVELHGLRAARSMWESARRSGLEFSALARRLRIKCQWQPRASIVLAARSEDAKLLAREYRERREAGLEASWLTAARLRERTRIEASGAIRTDGNASIDPYRACLAVASAAARRGAVVFERSPVSRVIARTKRVEIKTDRGTVHASTIVIATAHPAGQYRSLARHFKRLETYFVATPTLPASVRKQLGQRDAVLWDRENPPHSIQNIPDEALIIGGADQPPGPSQRAEKVIRQRTGQLMYELSTMYPAISGIQPIGSWATVVSDTPDGFPYLGPHRNYPRHLFALGVGTSSAAFGMLAARLLVRAYQGEPAKSDAFLSFQRART